MGLSVGWPGLGGYGPETGTLRLQMKRLGHWGHWSHPHLPQAPDLLKEGCMPAVTPCSLIFLD